MASSSLLRLLVGCSLGIKKGIDPCVLEGGPESFVKASNDPEEAPKVLETLQNIFLVALESRSITWFCIDL